MTAIAACVDAQKTIWMGGDSAGVSRWGSCSMARRKVFCKSGFIFGCAGSFRMMDIIEHCFSLPDRFIRQTIEQYLCAEFVPALRTAFRDQGFAQLNEAEEMDACFFIGHQGRLFEVQADYSLLCRDAPYGALGIGEEFCIGSLHALSHAPKLRGDKRLAITLEAAAANSSGVRAPFHIEKLPFDKNAPR